MFASAFPYFEADAELGVPQIIKLSLTFQVPPGLILDPEKLLQSSLLKEIIEFGKTYIEASKEGDDENFDSEIKS